MARYLLSVHTKADEAPRQMTEEDMRAGFAAVADLEAEMQAANALVLSGRLVEARRASVVRAKKGRVTVTDGPFVEAKEALGGFYIIDAPDDDAARSWASKTSAAINQPIEVRSFWSPPGP